MAAGPAYRRTPETLAPMVADLRIRVQFRCSGSDLDSAGSGDDAGKQGRVPRPKNPESGAPGQPAEVAPAYVFFASQESSYLTAEVLGVTGGLPIT